jgi:hypothetical protein
VSLLH